MPTAGQRQATAPGPRGSLLLGMAGELRRDQLGTLERAMTAYGDVVRLVAGPPGRRVGFHLVTHPDGVQRVLAGGAGDYVKGSRFYREMAATLGDGLVTIGSQFALTEAVVATAVLLTANELRSDAVPVPLTTAITLRPARPVRCEVVPRQPVATAPAAAPRSPGRT
jgi:cytochrome P450